MAAAPSELNSSSIEVLRAEMDDMIAWSNKLRSELDLNYTDHFAQMDRLVSAQRELMIKYDVLQSKFDHFIDEHWRPMQHFACGVVSCLAVFAGDASFELPFNVGAGSESGTPCPILGDNRRLPGTGNNDYVWSPNGCSGRWQRSTDWRRPRGRLSRRWWTWGWR